jgi:hypothetical protein
MMVALAPWQQRSQEINGFFAVKPKQGRLI